MNTVYIKRLVFVMKMNSVLCDAGAEAAYNFDEFQSWKD